MYTGGTSKRGKNKFINKMRNLGVFILIFLCSSGVSYVEGDWNGKSCAFTFSSDDGRYSNMDWKSIFDRFGYHFTIFTNPLISELSVEQLIALHEAGHEIASHSMTHRHLIKNTAFTIQYVGDADSSRMRVLGDTLNLYSEKVDENYRIELTDSFCQYLVDLVSYIDSLPSYSCTLDYYPNRYWPCASRYLVETDWQDIKTQPYQALTEAGSSMEQLLYEVCGAKEWLDSVITDSSYECKTFAYPFDEHDLREMIVVRDSAKHIAARNGSPTGIPFGTNWNASWDRVGLYEMVLGPGSGFLCGNNSFTEVETRNTIREFINEWKQYNRWSVICTHSIANIDTLHMKWILDELQKDGDVWVETFGTIAEYVRATHYTEDGWYWVPGSGVEENQKSNFYKNQKLEAYPNPFTQSTVISFQLSAKCQLLNAKCCIYDLSGKLIREFPINPPQAGLMINEVTWDSGDARGNRVESGIYFVVLQIGAEKLTHKLVKLISWDAQM